MNLFIFVAAHNGRETRGVLAESTSKTVGSSAYSIICLFLNCALLFFAPLVGCLLASATVSYQSSLPWHCVIVLARQTFSDVHPAALLSSVYFYWSIVCVYFGSCTLRLLAAQNLIFPVYRTYSHALNVVKYQTFDIPWRFRRDHVSHMRLDRLRRVCPPNHRPAGVPPPKKSEYFFSLRLNHLKTC